jgi:hypothetical protein
MKFAVDKVTAIVEAACAAITQLEKEKISEKEQQEAATNLLAGIPYLEHLKYEYPHQTFPFKLYRVRAEKGIGEEESINQVRTFSYPAPEKCELARANKKGCPVFYVADNPITALKEAECKEGDSVFVSEWQVKNAEKARLFLFFDHPLPKQHPWEKVRAKQEEQFHQSLAGSSKAAREKWHQLHKAYCKAFLGDEYTLSSLIGHELLYANKKPDTNILVYPSCVEADQYCNLAIHPDFADQYLQMTGIWKLKVTDQNFEKNPEVLLAGNIDKQNISWHPATQKEQKDFPF